jgi:hypothetical protein
MLRPVTVLSVGLSPIGSPMAGEVLPCFVPGQECAGQEIDSAREAIPIRSSSPVSDHAALRSAREDRHAVGVILDV